MNLKLHHCPETRSMRVLWLIEELGCPVEVITHAFGPDLHSKDYRAIHPAGRVPALEIDDTVIFESGAMLELLCEMFPEPGMGRAQGDPERPLWLQWIHFAETISQHSAALTQQHVALREDWMRSPIITKIEAKRLARCLATLETALEGRDYLLAKGFSAADIACGQAVAMSRHFVKLADFPRLEAWWERLRTRDAYHRAAPQPGETRLYDRPFYAPLPEPAR